MFSVPRRPCAVSSNRKLKPSPAPALPLKWALGLTVGVTLAHLWLLDSTLRPLSLDAAVPPSQPSATAVNSNMPTRRIEPAPLKAGTPVSATFLTWVPSAQFERASSASPAVSPATPSTPTPPTSATAAEPTPPTQAAEPQLKAAAEAEAEAEAKVYAEAHPEATPPSASNTNPEPAQRLPADLNPNPLAATQATAPLAQTAAFQTPPPFDTPKLLLPPSVRLRYELSGQSRGLNYTANALLTWQNEGTRYEARLLISGLLILTPRLSISAGELGPQGVAPRRFSDKARSEQATHFEPERGRIVFSNNAPEAPWQPGVQDRLSLFFQLAGMLAGDPERYVPGTQVRVPTTGTREVDTWTFTVTGTPTLALPSGEQATLALRREPRRDYDQTVEVWFAPNLGFVPVRMRITQSNGDVLDQKLAASQPW